MYTKELPPNYSKREHHLEQNQWINKCWLIFRYVWYW
jgi:hypothetical protein